MWFLNVTKKHPGPEKMKFWTKKNRRSYREFGISVPQTSTSPNLKTPTTSVLL